MKETRKFFENNRLNKGYGKMPNYRQNDVSIMRKKYGHVLPPVDIMAEYEELNPGTVEKLMDMAQKEQNHRHSMDLLEIEKYNRASKLGRMFSLILIAIISITTLVLATFSDIIAIIFPVISFASIAVAAYFYSKINITKSNIKEFKPREFQNRNRKPR